MAINTDVVGSPGWWMKRLFLMIGDSRRRQRLSRLHDYSRGRPPLPEGAAAARESYEAFVKKARANFAALVVGALSERINCVGFRTGQDNDETGDQIVGAMWERAGMDVECADLQDMMFTHGEAYMIVGGLDPETGAPVVTAEDPRWMVGEPDPANPRRLRAALKVIFDDMVNEDRAYLYLPGAVLVARRPRGQIEAVYQGPALHGEPRQPLMYFSEQTWQWDRERSGELAHGRIPVVRFANAYDMGEFEPHIDTLDRINHSILQCMVITTMQAFRVRAVKGLPDKDPTTGKDIDYSDIFRLDPGSIWQLPAGADLWESGVTDIRPILDAIKDDLTRLASATRTPLHMLDPGGANQSAEGASLQREGLTFKAGDRISRLKPSYARVASLMLHVMGDPQRADLSKLQPIFASVERLSLAERADAAAKATASNLPMKTILTMIWGMSPDEAERTLSEVADEKLFQTQLAAALADQPGVTGGTRTQDGALAGPAADRTTRAEVVSGDQLALPAGQVGTTAG